MNQKECGGNWLYTCIDDGCIVIPNTERHIITHLVLGRLSVLVSGSSRASAENTEQQLQ